MAGRTTRRTRALGGIGVAVAMVVGFAPGNAQATPVTAVAPSAAPPTVLPVANQPAKKKAKGLRVRVVRPAEARTMVKVVVRGPRQKRNGKKFRKVIRSTKTWKKLKPGRYRITAVRIGLYDQTVTAHVTRKKVRIPRSRARRTVTVTYRRPIFCSAGGTRLHGWGDNVQGQLGTGFGGLSARPVANPWIRGAKAVTGSRSSTYALCANGTVWAWGSNAMGELGFGRSGSRRWPVRVRGLTGVVSIAAAVNTGFALRSDGSVWAWGNGRYGQLGNGTAGFGVKSTSPVRVHLPAGRRAVQLVAGGHTAWALLDDGRVMAWGNGGVGQAGIGSSQESIATPVASSLTGVSQIAAGRETLYAIASGELWGWGNNGQGQIQNGASLVRTSPLLIIGASRVWAGRAAVFRSAGGAVSSWGSGRHHDTTRDTGGNLAGIAGIQVPFPHAEIEDLVSKGHGGYILRNGRAWGWGAHDRGQAGTGAPLTGASASQGLLVGQIPLTGVRAIGAGELNGYAIG